MTATERKKFETKFINEILKSGNWLDVYNELCDSSAFYDDIIYDNNVDYLNERFEDKTPFEIIRIISSNKYKFNDPYFLLSAKFNDPYFLSSATIISFVETEAKKYAKTILTDIIPYFFDEIDEGYRKNIDAIDQNHVLSSLIDEYMNIPESSLHKYDNFINS